MSKAAKDNASKLNWHSLAASLNVELSGMAFHSEAIDALDGFSGDLGIACSGGADSLLLLLLAWERLPQMRKQMVVLHYNHGLRAEESDDDEDFVKVVAQSLDLGFQSQRCSAQNEPVSEESLRNLRLAFFRESGCPVILQGHHGDDVLETMLMRICRGSGAEGLSAPRPVHRHRNGLTFIRPLLNFERTKIQESLRSVGIPWREDRSNAGRDFFRNRIRHDVISALKTVSEHNPVAGALRSRELLAEDSDALITVAGNAFVNDGAGTVSLAETNQSPAVLRRVAQSWLMRQDGLQLSASALDQLVTHLVARKPILLAAGDGFVEFDGALLRRQSGEMAPIDWCEIPLIPGVNVYLPGHFKLKATLVELTDERREQIFSGNVSVSKEAFLAGDQNIFDKLSVRRWSDGDRYHSLGAPGSKKLQDLFTNAKIPRMERKRIPLVCLGNKGIAWIPGFPPCEALKITTTTKQALWLTCDHT